MKLGPGALLIIACSTLLGTGCSRVQSKAAYQDGNKLYKEENFKRAIEKYGTAIQHDPNMIEAYFYLASSHQALHRPGKDTPENKEHLDACVANYKKVLELAGANPEIATKVKANALGALVGVYAEEPYRDFEQARTYAEQLVRDQPDDVRNLYAMANLYERFGHVAEAEAAYKRAAELNPNDTKACGALAGFFNKPLWEESGAPLGPGSDKSGRARFDEAVSTLERCASLDPNDASGWQKVSAFYWDKAYRDPLLDDKRKDEYADKGLEAVNKALSVKPDYFEAVIYKGLLYRVKAAVARNPAIRMRFLDEAQQLQKQGLELKKQLETTQAAAKS